MTDSTTSALPARPAPNLICPLCGGQNGCAPAACGDFDAPCWCRDTTFTEALLARVPPGRRGLACICLACAQAALPVTGR